MRIAQSSIFISGCMFVVIGVIACIFALRVVMSSTKSLTFSGVQLGGIIASILNAIQIQVRVMILYVKLVNISGFQHFIWQLCSCVE